MCKGLIVTHHDSLYFCDSLKEIGEEIYEQQMLLRDEAFSNVNQTREESFKVLCQLELYFSPSYSHRARMQETVIDFIEEVPSPVTLTVLIHH